MPFTMFVIGPQLLLQIGQVSFSVTQGLKHRGWNWCPQFNLRKASFALNVSMQMQQITQSDESLDSSPEVDIIWAGGSSSQVFGVRVQMSFRTLLDDWCGKGYTCWGCEAFVPECSLWDKASFFEVLLLLRGVTSCIAEDVVMGIYWWGWNNGGIVLEMYSWY